MPSPIPTALSRGFFGVGAHEPYDRALQDPARQLYLQDFDRGFADSVPLEVDRFLAGADEHDAEALRGLHGPVIDVGCGPGRMVRAAILAGHIALGIDISSVAVHIAQGHGLPVLRRSIFQELPAEGTWGAALLIDGNIGIGGDPEMLLARCRDLVRDTADGRVVVEAHREPSRDHAFQGVLVDDLARQSLPFPWAEVGTDALHRYAERAGLNLVRERSHGDRTFVEYALA